MEDIWHHTFYNELRVAPEEHPVLLTETPLNRKVNREKTAQIMFETYNTLLCTCPETRYCLCGCTTGLVVDSGHMSSHVVPVLKGEVVTPAVARLDIAGSHLTGYLLKLLSETAILSAVRV